MNAIIRNIPNYITMANLCCGILSIILTFNNQLSLAALFIFLGTFLDFFDGFFARLLKMENEFGLQLDSLADLVTSGLAPSFILFKLLNTSNTTQLFDEFSFEIPFSSISLIAFLIPIFAALRLANFNIDKNQKNSFIGLPTPMTAIFIASIPLIKSEFFNSFYSNTSTLCIISVVLSILMISKLNLFSIKVNFQENLSSQLNMMRLFMLISSLILLFFFNLAAIPFIVVLYIILSIINNLL
jgi:CDP-diacylglycerol--serine O-phosphatidyltransferase